MEISLGIVILIIIYVLGLFNTYRAVRDLFNNELNIGLIPFIHGVASGALTSVLIFILLIEYIFAPIIVWLFNINLFII